MLSQDIKLGSGHRVLLQVGTTERNFKVGEAIDKPNYHGVRLSTILVTLLANETGLTCFSRHFRLSQRRFNGYLTCLSRQANEAGANAIGMDERPGEGEGLMQNMERQSDAKMQEEQRMPRSYSQQDRPTTAP